MLLIVQIALGIVVGFILLALLPSIIRGSALVLMIVVPLAILVGVVVVAFLDPTDFVAFLEILGVVGVPLIALHFFKKTKIAKKWFGDFPSTWDNVK